MKYLDKDYKKKFIDNDQLYKEDVYIPDNSQVGFCENFSRDCMITIPEKEQPMVMLEDVSDFSQGRVLSENSLFTGSYKFAKDVLLEQRKGQFDQMCDDLAFAVRENCLDAFMEDYELIRGYIDDCYALKLMEAEEPSVNACIKYYEHLINAVNNNELLNEWKADKFIIEECIKNSAKLDAVKDKFCPPSTKGCQKHIEATGVPGCVGSQKADGLKKDVDRSGVVKTPLLEPDTQLVTIEDRSLEENIWDIDM